MDDKFVISEAHWCREAGIPRWRVQLLRRRNFLTRGKDYDRVSAKGKGNRVVCLSAAGIKRIEEHFGVVYETRQTPWLDRTVAAASGEVSGVSKEAEASVPSSSPADGGVEMVVSRACANPRLVEAEVRGALGVQYVDVGSNANFVSGDRISVIPHPDQFGLWALSGGATNDVLPRDKRRLPDGSWALV
jgi:hypothetical protein